jgi:sulfite reductase (NADPH) hemoprotein beta-component
VGAPGDDGSEGAPRVRAPEAIKTTSNYLRGTIAQGLRDESTGALAYEDTLLTKFHGIYQQDDRDLRGARKKAGLEPAYSFMVRVRIPGGVCTPAQYLALDALADSHANGTLRVTTRQAIQFHGIIKGKLKPAIAAINRALMDTLAACGDVNRNVMCSANPDDKGGLHAAVLDFSRRLSDRLSPRTTAYHEIWCDNVLVGGGGADLEPIYGPTYLPRKFKIAVAIPPHNDVDVFAHCLGFVAVAGAGGALEGFTITAGGGMGMTHNAPATFPRLAEPLCFAGVEEALAIAEAVVTTQRDFGDRTNRRHSRFKYTVDDRGIPWLAGEVGARVGFPLQPPRPFAFTSNGDALGWTPGAAGAVNYTLFVQNGRVKDAEGYALKTGLRAFAALGVGEVRFTANQNVILANIPVGARPAVDALLGAHGLHNKRHTGLRLNSMACVALPTCGLSLAEAERYLPSLLDKLDAEVEAAGLRDDAIVIRMTGCPNGCARPYVAEVGLVGRSPGIYNLYLGAGFSGERLNKLYREDVGEEAIVGALRPLFKRYAVERTAGEHFGDWVVRAGVVKPNLSGRTFHEL